VIDKPCQGLKIALCLSLAALQSFITVWEYCTHTDNSSLVDSAVSASESVRAAVILIALQRAVNHGLKRLNCVKIKMYFSLDSQSMWSILVLNWFYIWHQRPSQHSTTFIWLNDIYYESCS